MRGWYFQWSCKRDYSQCNRGFAEHFVDNVADNLVVIHLIHFGVRARMASETEMILDNRSILPLGLEKMIELVRVPFQRVDCHHCRSVLVGYHVVAFLGSSSLAVLVSRCSSFD